MVQLSLEKDQFAKEAKMPFIALLIEDESNQEALFGKSVKKTIANAELVKKFNERKVKWMEDGLIKKVNTHSNYLKK